MTQTRTTKSKPTTVARADLPAGFHMNPGSSPPFQTAPATPRQMIERGILAITLVALGISVLVFLWAADQFITTWFRPQWVPVARGLGSLAVVLLCLYVLKWLADRRRAA